MGVTQIDAMAQIAPEDVPTATWDGVGEPPPEMLFAHMDTNGDGFLDAQEMDGASENEIRQIDKNGDGLIDVNELKEAIKKEEMKEDSVIEETPRSAQIAPEDVPSVVAWDGVGEPPPEMLLAHMDTNGDGGLDAQELGAGEHEFRQIDKNGDGLIDVNEMKEAIKVMETKEDSVIEEAPPVYIEDDSGGTCYSGRQWCRRQWIPVVAASCCIAIIAGLIVGLVVVSGMDDTSLTSDWISSTCNLTAIAGTTTVCGEGGCENLYYCDTSSRRRTDTRRRSDGCSARRRRRGLDPLSLPTCKAPGYKRGCDTWSCLPPHAYLTYSVSVTSSAFTGVRVGTKCPEVAVINTELPTTPQELHAWLHAKLDSVGNRTEVPCWYEPSGQMIDSVRMLYDSNVRLDTDSNCDSTSEKALWTILLSLGLGLIVACGCCGGIYVACCKDNQGYD